MTTWKFTLEELLLPSDRHIVRPFRRFVRRSVVLVLGFASVFAAAIWLHSQTGYPDWPSWSFRWHGSDVSIAPGKMTLLATEFVDGWFFVFATGGHVAVDYYCIIPHRDVRPPTRAFDFLGIQWRQGLPSGACMSEEFERRGRLPLWIPFVLFTAWPIIAFIRGPYHRAARRAKGCRLKCGDNLTGLVEPRCPECGASTFAGPRSEPTATL